MARAHEARCYVSKGQGEKHRKACRKDRPLCKWRRRDLALTKASADEETDGGPCTCAAYGFPHRKGSGPCGDLERMNLLVWGPPKETAA